MLKIGIKKKLKRLGTNFQHQLDNPAKSSAT